MCANGDDAPGRCCAWITSDMVCCVPDTVLVQGWPLCPIHVRTFLHFGELHLEGDVWIAADPAERVLIPNIETDRRARLGVCFASVARDTPPAPRPEPVFTEVEPVDGSAAAQMTLFG